MNDMQRSWLVAVKSAPDPIGPGELSAPIVFKDEARRIVYGPVLIPDEPDVDGDQVTAEKIEAVAHTFLKDYGTIDVKHTLNFAGRPVESYIAPQDLQFETSDGTVIIPKGTWMLGVYVEDSETWARVMRGELTGFSIMAVSRAKAVKESVPKRVTLRDLGEGWVVVAVSLVERPAVPMAKWISVKSQSELSPVQRTLAALLGIPVAGKGQTVSTKTMGLMRSAYDALGALLQDGAGERFNTASEKGADEVNEEQMKAAVETAVKAAVAPLEQRLASIEAATKQKPAEQEPAAAAAGTGATEPTEDPAVKELLTKIDERLQAVEKESGLTSRQPEGQDSTMPPAATKSAPRRDAFGRKIRT